MENLEKLTWAVERENFPLSVDITSTTRINQKYNWNINQLKINQPFLLAKKSGDKACDFQVIY